MSAIAELYKCKDCNNVSIEHPGMCPECEGEVECIDYAPIDGNINIYDAGLSDGKRQRQPEIDDLNTTIKKMSRLAHTMYAYMNNPKEIEVWIDEIIRVANSDTKLSPTSKV